MCDNCRARSLVVVCLCPGSFPRTLCRFCTPVRIAVRDSILAFKVSSRVLVKFMGPLVVEVRLIIVSGGSIDGIYTYILSAYSPWIRSAQINPTPSSGCMTRSECGRTSERGILYVYGENAWFAILFWGGIVTSGIGLEVEGMNMSVGESSPRVNGFRRAT
jgi:hypothetical protein